MDGSLFAQTAFAQFSAERPAAALKKAVWMGYHPHSFCLLISPRQLHRVEKIEAEVTADGKPFRRKKIFNFMIRYLCPVFAAIILVSSVANALGWISM